MTAQLRKVLFPPGVDQWELAQLLLTHFHGAREISASEIAYGYVDDQFALKLCYKDAVLHDIIGGSLLKETDVSDLEKQISTNLLGMYPPHIAHQVMFAHLPVHGWFRYGEKFQITSLPLDAPRPPHLMGEHPFLLSFAYRGSPDMTVRSVRQVHTVRELELLCFALLMYVSGSSRRNVQFHWVYDPEHGVPPGSSRHLQGGYSWPSSASLGETFPQTSDIEEITLEEPEKYYSLFALSTNQRFTAPANLVTLLDVFYSLDDATKERFLRSCFWFKHAHDMHHYSQSAVFTALIAAIEALIPKGEGATRCTQCGHHIGPSARHQFAEFVEKYVPGTGFTASQKKNLYSIRSALSHGGTLLLHDQRGWGGLNPKGIGEDRNVRAMQHMVRIALINWLADAPNV